MKVFVRHALYEEVWTSPVSKIATKHGISDNGLRKICKALSIPLPPRGHWAKIAAGYESPRPLLPPSNGRTEYVRDSVVAGSPCPSHVTPTKGTTRRSSVERTDDAKWFREKASFEGRSENFVSVRTSPSYLHPLILATQKAVHDEVKRIDRLERQLLSTARKGGRYNAVELEWERFTDRGQLLHLANCYLPLRVTRGTCERALAIFNSLLIAGEQREVISAYDAGTKKLSFRVLDCQVFVWLTEKLRSVPRTSPVGFMAYKKTSRVPTGILCMHIAGGKSVAEIQDEDDHALDDRLNEVIVGIYRAALRTREASRVEAAERLEREAQLERDRKQAAEQAELERRRALEAARRRALYKEAARWKRAAVIAAYIDHLERGIAQGPPAPPHLVAWLTRARNAALELDPTYERLDPVRQYDP